MVGSCDKGVLFLEFFSAEVIVKHLAVFRARGVTSEYALRFDTPFLVLSQFLRKPPLEEPFM
jgi:hypothetical protein